MFEIIIRKLEVGAVQGLFVVLLLIVRFLVVDLEVTELVGVLGGGDHTQPVPQVVLLQVLLGPIFINKSTSSVHLNSW